MTPTRQQAKHHAAALTWEALGEAGVTQGEAARALGLSRKTVQAWCDESRVLTMNLDHLVILVSEFPAIADAVARKLNRLTQGRPKCLVTIQSTPTDPSMRGITAPEVSRGHMRHSQHAGRRSTKSATPYLPNLGP